MTKQQQNLINFMSDNIELKDASNVENLAEKNENFMWRALWLFLNFFLIIAAYYQIKPASRSLAIEYIGTDNIPYLWIASALLLGLLMPGYQWLVKHSRRRLLNLYSITLFMLLLVGFYFILGSPGLNSTIGFYLLADIFSVILVEQFWSLSNSVSNTQSAKKWYGLIGAGGLSGGIFGSFLASWLIKDWSLTSHDLLLVAVVFILFLLVLTLFLAPKGIYLEGHLKSPLMENENDKFKSDNSSPLPETIVRPRYLVYITAILCLAQLVEPIVEYQFLKIIEITYPLRDERTAYISLFLGWLGIISLMINLLITPLVHRFLGVIIGLCIQPFCVLMSAMVFLSGPNLLTGSILKIADRGLSYSLNRASKEMLYVPIPTRQIYQLKAWIDMFGYRLFKLTGAVLILVFTQWSFYKLALEDFSYIVMLTCLLWLAFVLWGIRKEYALILKSVTVKPNQA